MRSGVIHFLFVCLCVFSCICFILAPKILLSPASVAVLARPHTFKELLDGEDVPLAEGSGLGLGLGGELNWFG